jgi:4-carboxymuconolactone decarboxylase
MADTVDGTRERAMPRLTPPKPESMSVEQRQVHDDVVARRGRVPAPTALWLTSPELARRAERLGEFARYQTSLPKRLSELAILVTARHWTSHYEWHAHKKDALAAGLDPKIVDAIQRREIPTFAAEDERAVYRFARALQESHAVDDALYRALAGAIDARGLVELVGILGYYTLVSMTLNVFEVPLPAGTVYELAP